MIYLQSTLRFGVLLLALIFMGCESTGSVPINMAQPDASKVHREELEATPLDEMDSDLILARAEGFRKVGKSNEALFYYVTYLEREPRHPAALAAVGHIHLEKKNLDLARTALEMSLEKDPENAQVLESLGVIALRQKDHNTAEAQLGKARLLNPKAPRTLTSLGLLEDQRGNHAKAQALYQEALESDPKNPGIRNNLAYSQYLGGAFGIALKTADETLQLVPNHEGTRMNRSLFLMKLGRADEAMTNFRQFLSEADASNNLGYLYLQQGDLSTARHYLELAIQASPSYHDLAHQNLRKLTQLEDRQLDSNHPVLVAEQKR